MFLYGLLEACHTGVSGACASFKKRFGACPFGFRV